jgi:hypothetical protein
MSSSVLSAINDEAGPMIASTSRSSSVWIDAVAVAVLLPSSATTRLTRWSSTPPAALIRSTAVSTAVAIGWPSSVVAERQEGTDHEASVAAGSPRVRRRRCASERSR